MKTGITVREMISVLKEYPMDSKVELTMIVDANKLDDLCGDIEGIYFVDGDVLGIDQSDDEETPVILAQDMNYDGTYEKDFM